MTLEWPNMVHVSCLSERIAIDHHGTPTNALEPATMQASMSEALLIEETGDRATDRLHQLLTLARLSFADGEARARSLAAARQGRIIDPVASACFAEARELLLRPAGERAELRAGLFAAIFALDAAATREPECYGLVYRGLRTLALTALDEVVALELASTHEFDTKPDPLAPETSATEPD